jgi:protein-tyrosine phosphatase
MVMSPALVHDRAIALDGVFNFRDLGGYETGDGRSVRWRHLFRADGLDRLTTDDLDVLDPIGLRTVLDLRSSPEIERNGRFPVEQYPLTWHHLSVVDTTWERDDSLPKELSPIDFLVHAYDKMLTEGAPRFATAFDLLAEADALPAAQ